MKLFDSELKIMEILWREGDISVKRIAEIAKEQIGWSKTTTYTNIKDASIKALSIKNKNVIINKLLWR